MQERHIEICRISALLLQLDSSRPCVCLFSHDTPIQYIVGKAAAARLVLLKALAINCMARRPLLVKLLEAQQALIWKLQQADHNGVRAF